MKKALKAFTPKLSCMALRNKKITGKVSEPVRRNLRNPKVVKKPQNQLEWKRYGRLNSILKYSL